MGKDIIEQIVNFDSLNLSFLCEKKNHRSIGKKIRDIFLKNEIEFSKIGFIDNSHSHLRVL